MVIAVSLPGCGGSVGNPAAVACKGIPHRNHSQSFLAVFGGEITKRLMCENAGPPTSIQRESGGREAWHYGRAAITFNGDRAVTPSQTNGADSGITVSSPSAGSLAAAKALQSRFSRDSAAHNCAAMLRDLRHIAQLTAPRAWSGQLSGHADRAPHATCVGVHATLIDRKRP